MILITRSRFSFFCFYSSCTVSNSLWIMNGLQTKSSVVFLLYCYTDLNLYRMCYWSVSMILIIVKCADVILLYCYQENICSIPHFLNDVFTLDCYLYGVFCFLSSPWDYVAFCMFVVGLNFMGTAIVCVVISTWKVQFMQRV